MKPFLMAVLLAAALAGCMEQEQPPRKPAAAKPPAGDAAAGKIVAARDCKACHGLDGGSTAPGIPILAAQHEGYLLSALKAYREGKRVHAALKDLTGHMSEADLRNVVAYYASLPPARNRTASDAQVVSPYDRGQAIAAGCARCHGADGNSTSAGIPSLAGQQPRYLVLAMMEYLREERAKAPMHGELSQMGRTERESVALYFASQQPAQRAAPPFGDAAAGEPLTAVCGGCHGPSGVSADTATPSLAGQDPRYLVEAIKAYRTIRKREKMREYVSALSEKEIENIAAFYAVQKSAPSEKGQEFVKQIAAKCDRCHGSAAATPDPSVPKSSGQDEDYLVMALRAYRDDRREVSAMHRMSLPYSDALIESISTYYARQPAK